jgi:hypothetical protein
VFADAGAVGVRQPVAWADQQPAVLVPKSKAAIAQVVEKISRGHDAASFSIFWSVW